MAAYRPLPASCKWTDALACSKTGVLVGGAKRLYGIVEGGDAKTQGIGVMTNDRWAGFFAATSQQGLFPKSLDYRSAYTLQFLPRVKA